MNEARLRESLRTASVPDERGARERAWRLVIASAAAAPRDRDRVRRPARRRGLQAALALVLLLVAAISPAGAAVRDWVGDAVDGNGHRPALPALTSLPAPGPLLVDSARGSWVVQGDGSKRLLGAYRQSTWSPRGLFVAAVGMGELVAIDPLGDVRWAVAREGALADPAWSPDGYRIAYLDAGALRLVAGDGTGDREIRPRAAAVAPAWRPGPGHVLTFAEPGGQLATIDADSGRALFGASPAARPIDLSWSRDGSRLLVVERSGLEVLDRRGRRLWRRPAPPGTEIVAAAQIPGREGVAAIVAGRAGPARSELSLIGPAGPASTAFSGPGRFTGVTASADGRRLLLEWESADQWIFLDLADPQRVVAVSDIAAQFAPGTTSPSSYPRVAGWCCQGPREAPAP
jgi:hypothetical protein